MQDIPCRRRLLMAAIIASAITGGCSSDERLVEVSRESLNRQAEQNREQAQQNQAVTQTTHELIQTESRVQGDATQLQGQLHVERRTLDQERHDLEQERRTLADQRQREPIIAEAIKAATSMIVAALPLVVCWYLLKSLFFATSDDGAAAELLVEQLATGGPLLTACAGIGLPHLRQDNPESIGLPEPSQQPIGALSGADVPSGSGALRVVVVVEGIHDVEFLKRISRILSDTDSSVPDLRHSESSGVLMFVVNNGTAKTFPTGISSRGPAEFHLLDREAAHVTVERQAAALAINSRPNCHAVLTSKRTIENYLHPAAIYEAGGISFSFGDFDDVLALVAHKSFDQRDGQAWTSLSRRARKRLREKAKRWLNRDAVDRMSAERLAERDPAGEVIGWLRTIAQLARPQADPHS